MATLAPQARAIRAALNKAGRHTIPKRPGLYLDVRSDGNGSFRLRYRVPGSSHQKWFTLTNDALAVLNAAPNAKGVGALDLLFRRAAQIQSDLKVHNKDPAEEAKLQRAKHRTYGDLFNDWLEDHSKKSKRERSWRDDEDIYRRHIKPRLGARKLSEISKQTILDLNRQVIQAITQDGNAREYGLKANHVFAIIRASFRWGVDHGKASHNPCVGIKKPVESRKRQPTATDEQMKMIWASLSKLPANQASICRLALLLGKRVSTLVGMEKQELDLNSATPAWIIPALRQGNKNSEQDIVCLPPLALEIISVAAGRSASKYVFPGRSSGIMDRQTPSKAFAAIAKQNGADLTLHDCRHLFGTGLARLRVPAEIRQRLLHHVTGRKASPTTDIYDEHDYLPEKRRALELWQARLIEIVEGRPPSGLKW